MRTDEYSRLFAAEEKSWWFRGLHNFIFTLLPQKSNLPVRVLDVGCGTGGLLRRFAVAGYETVGIDFSRTALDFAREQSKTLVEANANMLPFRDAFHLVISVDVLEVRTVEPKALVRGILRALHPGGQALLVMAAHQWLLSDHDRAVDSVRRFNLRELQNLFENEDVKIIRSTYLFFLFFPLIALCKLLNPIRAGVAKSDVSVPPAIFNLPLFWILWLEGQLLRFVDWPIGSSVCILIKKE